MLLTEGEADLLQVHLEGVLQRLCDADSVTMAEYVVALLKHDKSETELRALCFEQLEEFLRDETAVFIDTLFKTIASREFLNDSSSKTLTTQPAPITATITAATQSNAVKRARDTVDDEVPASTSHGRRDDEDDDEDDEDDYRRGRRRKRNVDEFDSNNGRNAAGGGPHGGVPGVGAGEVRPIESFYYDDHQRDRGAFNRNMGIGERGGYQQRQPAPYGPQQQIWGQGFGMGGQRSGFRGGPRGPMGMNGMGMHQGGGMMGSTMMMGVGIGMNMGGGPPRIRNRCFEFDGTGHCSRGDTCRFDHSPLPTQQPIASGIVPIIGPNGMPFAGPSGFMMSEGAFSMQPTAFDESNRMSYNYSFRGRGRGRGGRGGGYSSFPSYPPPHRRPQNDTLTVENIPVESCTLDAVNAVFKGFGTIIDIKIEPHTRSATVRYSRVEEAKAAHGNPEAYFGNRFVKVYFAPPLEEAVPGVSASGQASDSSVVTVSGAPGGVPGGAIHGSAAAVEDPQGPFLPVHIAAARRKAQVKEETQTQYETHLKAQKDLLQMLLSPAIKPDRKAELLAALKSIEVRVAEGMEKLKQFAEEEKVAIDAAKARQWPISAGLRPVSSSEMDKAAAGSESMDGVEAPSVTAGSAADEVAELEALKAQAAAAGLDPNAITGGAFGTGASATGSPATGGPILRGGFRGNRGGAWRSGGRGGARPVALPQTFSLDLRTKKLRVHGASGKDKVILMQQFQLYGQVVKLDFDEAGLIIEFQARHHAEKALSLGVKDGNAASLKLEWHEDSKSPVAANSATTANVATSVKAAGKKDDVLMDGE